MSNDVRTVGHLGLRHHRWAASSSWAECRRLLPGHPWLGRQGSHLSISRGDVWVVAAGVAMLRLGRRRRGSEAVDLLRITRPASIAAEGELCLPAGTLLHVADIGGYSDPGCAWPGVGDHIEFELPGGSAHALLTTFEMVAATRDSDGPWPDMVDWGQIMASAGIVPAGHPFARDRGPLATALARIEETATSNAGRAAGP